jgi:hypothetical protein
MSSEHERERHPEVAIVILTWENYEEAADCIDSLESITYPNYRVIVVDNGSNDGSIEALQDDYDWCEFVLNGENKGFSRGNNEGIRYALETGTDYVLLLNDDTIVMEDFLDPLVETMESHDRVAAVGGVNLFADSGEIHNAGYKFYPVLAGGGVLYRRPKDDQPYPVDYVQSCLVLLDPAFLDEVGLLNENYFLGMEDVDLAWKARERGWKVLTDPRSRIYHHVGETAGRVSRSPFSSYHKIRNKLHFAAENLPFWRRLSLYASLTVETAILFVLWALIGDRQNIRATLLGARDYFADADFRDYDALAG